MRAPAVLALVALAGAATAQPTADRLRAAKRTASAAASRAAALEANAQAATGATRSRAAAIALRARIDATAAEVAVAEARAALVGTRVATQRVQLAREQAPAARLLAALQSLARRPPIAALAQPGSVDDLVHARAALGAILPAIRARTQAVRGELDRNRSLERSARLAARALGDGRARLERQRLALARSEAQARAAGRAGVGIESDRALALGEAARDTVGALAVVQDAAAVEARLLALPGPLPRPDTVLRAAPPPAGYRVPVVGAVVGGLGEIAATGAHARGITFAPAPGAAIRAPAGGVVRYARRFRGYAGVMVIDHGAGWNSTLTGLSRAVAAGTRVRAGQRVGLATTGETPRVTVELRRRGRPVDAAMLIAAG